MPAKYARITFTDKTGYVMTLDMPMGKIKAFRQRVESSGGTLTSSKPVKA